MVSRLVIYIFSCTIFLTAIDIVWATNRHLAPSRSNLRNFSRVPRAISPVGRPSASRPAPEAEGPSVECPVGQSLCDITTLSCAAVCCMEYGVAVGGCEAGYYCYGEGVNGGCCPEGEICEETPVMCANATVTGVPEDVTICEPNKPICFKDKVGGEQCGGTIEDYNAMLEGRDPVTSNEFFTGEGPSNSSLSTTNSTSSSSSVVATLAAAHSLLLLGVALALGGCLI